MQLIINASSKKCHNVLLGEWPMIKKVCHKTMVCLLIASVLGLTGCSVFVSTPKVASFHIQQLDNKFVEVLVSLDDSAETNMDIHLNNRYTLQLDFDWLWNMDQRSEIYLDLESDTNSEDPLLTPWMICKYRF